MDASREASSRESDQSTPPPPEAWRAVDDLFEAALDRPAGERDAFLDEACADRPEFRAEVEALLAAEEAAGPWIDRSARAIRNVARTALPGQPDQPEQKMVGRRIGAWRILRRLGRGGMGNVYLAERADGQYEQRAALKLLRRGLDTDDILGRFLAERQILATLAHPHIARLLDGGATERGRPYFVLEYVEGEPIDEYCDRRELGIDERLRLFVTVCRTVEHAHRNRVLHRDLKPSNILVTAEGEVKLLDFGIAKLLVDPVPDEPEASDGAEGAGASAAAPGERGAGAPASPPSPPSPPRTRTGARLMTPEYASPEQVRGERVTSASDVYQLGMLLYELLTGTRPYEVRNRSAATVERLVCEEEPPAPSRRVGSLGERRRQLRGDLDAICLQALRKEPERRYSSAAELAEDLERHRSGRPVRARRPTLGYRVRKLVRRHRAAVAAGAAFLALLLVLAGLLARTGPGVGSGMAAAPAGPIAVGEITAAGRALTGWTAPARDVLATALARIPEFEVLSPPRMAELLAQVEAEDGGPETGTAGSGPAAGAADAGAASSTRRASVREAARRGGAAALVEGTLFASRAGFRLDLQWIDLASDEVRHTARVEAADVSRLAERATARVARAHGIRPPPGRLTDVITRSPIAYRFYEEGLRAYYEGDNGAARRLLSAALAEDSTFAMAAYYRALSRRDVDHAAFRRDLIRAARFADRASDRERLLIRTAWAREMDEPRQLALAETLAVRYPSEPEGHLFYGEALLWSGDFLRALPHLDEVLALDSLSLQGESPRCRACDAIRSRINAYLLADSLAAAEREARKWVELQPSSARALLALASTLEYQGQLREALRVRMRRAVRAADDPRDAVYPAILALRAGDFERADRLLDEQDLGDASLVQQNVLWFRTLGLLYRDRFDEALQAARSYREVVSAADVPAQRPPWEAVLEAQVLLEMGRPRAAAALWREMASYPYEPESAARTARHRAWTLTQLATALAAAGDTAALPALADTIEAHGRQSAYGRDPRLHHYVRGLILSARGDTAGAIDAHRRAIFSSTAGYGRINLELGRLLLAAGRPEEAVAVVGAGLRGPLDAGNLYLNRTDLHELLARAHREVGAADSAAAHARWAAARPTG